MAERHGTTTARTALRALLLALALPLGALAATAEATRAAPSPWLDGGRPTPLAHEAVGLLADAASHGLDPLDYRADALRERLARAAQGLPADAAAIASLAPALDAALQRYLADLHRGRVDPRRLRQTSSVPERPAFDAAQALQTAVAQGRLADTVRTLAPPMPLYEQLRAELARYRALGAPAAWAQPLAPLPPGGPGRTPALAAGQPWDGLERLAQRLTALGDLAPDAAVPPRHEGVLVDALRAFQERHGLQADGVLGRATLRQLNVAPAARVRQIELMLERLRWTPLLQGPRMVVVNVPEFVLRAYEVDAAGRIQVRLAMKVIVGRSMDTSTPLFDEEMRAIEFSPYWNVPPSIARGELLPRLRRDPGHFGVQGFEFVDGAGGVHRELSAAALDAVAAGRWRIRQRPGPANALGDIKFVFPNRANIYLHHTPAVGLFERDRRDFSHGCIRVEQPVALAGFVLQGMPDWTPERIEQAMARGQSSTLRLEAPVHVLIGYGTTLVKAGRVHFFDDIYGHDRRLDAALRQRSQALRRPTGPA